MLTLYAIILLVVGSTAMWEGVTTLKGKGTHMDTIWGIILLVLAGVACGQGMIIACDGFLPPAR